MKHAYVSADRLCVRFESLAVELFAAIGVQDIADRHVPNTWDGAIFREYRISSEERQALVAHGVREFDDDFYKGDYEPYGC